MQVLAYHDENHRRDFNNILSNILIPRVPGTATHLQVNNFIKSEFSQLGWSVEEDAFSANTPYGSKPFMNIIATQNPNACKRLVLACHYDSKYFPRDVFLGATDSAAPCAIMIHVAKILNQPLQQRTKVRTNHALMMICDTHFIFFLLKQQRPFDTTLQMIFFDGEEAWKEWSDADSLYGSRHLADKWHRTQAGEACRSRDVVTELDRIDLFVLLDLLGAKNPSIPSFFSDTDDHYKRLYHLERDFHSRGHLLTASNGKRSYFMSGYRGMGSIQDDHIPFYRRGVKKILHIIPPEFPSVWHKTTDDASALDDKTMRNWITLFKGFVSQHLRLELRSVHRWRWWCNTWMSIQVVLMLLSCLCQSSLRSHRHMDSLWHKLIFVWGSFSFLLFTKLDN